MSGYYNNDSYYPDRRYDSSRGHSRGGYRGGRDHYRGSYYRGRGKPLSSRGRDFRREYDRDYRERDPRDRERDFRDRDPRDRDSRDRERDYREIDPRERDSRDREVDYRDREYRDFRDHRKNDYSDYREHRDREPSWGKESRDRNSPREPRDSREYRSDARGDHRGSRGEFSKDPVRSLSGGTPKYETSSPRHTPRHTSETGDHAATPSSTSSGPVAPSSSTCTDPWISILQISDEKVAKRLESRHLELANVNKTLGQLQLQRHKLKAHMDLLDVYAKRDALNVEMTSEKLDEFAFM
ncbi:hypothetical protein FDK38_005219 [Candidozyma auris]|nr:hypothetical protein FDK38_005219 [[Candida] auris]